MEDSEPDEEEKNEEIDNGLGQDGLRPDDEGSDDKGYCEIEKHKNIQTVREGPQNPRAESSGQRPVQKIAKKATQKTPSGAITSTHLYLHLPARLLGSTLVRRRLRLFWPARVVFRVARLSSGSWQRTCNRS